MTIEYKWHLKFYPAVQNFITMYVYTKSMLLLSLFFAFSIFSCRADTTDYYQPDYLRFEDFIYRDNIKTVLLEGAQAALTDPSIELNSTQQLKLSFDELDVSFNDYSYTIIHCNAAWQPGDLSESQYLQSFSTDRITTYQNSSTALMPYVHYELVFPNEIIKPAISGNYIIKIFDTVNPDSVIITKRFVVFEQKLNIDAKIHAATFADKRITHQEIDFTINTANLNITNAYHDLQVVIMQNGRWDNLLTGLKPMFVNGNVLDYNYDDENTMEGGNEFRTFDIRSIRYHSERIGDVELNPATQQYEVFLLPDDRISSQRYAYQNDINGRYLIKHTEGRNSDIDGDYVKVHFRLKMNYAEEGGTMHVFGALTQWKADAENRMNYNEETRMYELTLLLKQGYYNYQYAFVADGKSTADVSLIEGSHYETENDYTILVYYKNPVKHGDELIGIKKINVNSR